uniref:Uncharacterized protein n=1 Tax=Timema douglasi TaxID=61478 RepID=A0A7R8ZEB1_TIMDO|nr:unnamed protein product [Timema douglasi]
MGSSVEWYFLLVLRILLMIGGIETNPGPKCGLPQDGSDPQHQQQPTVDHRAPPRRRNRPSEDDQQQPSINLLFQQFVQAFTRTTQEEREARRADTQRKEEEERVAREENERLRKEELRMWIGRYRSFHCDNDWNKCAEVLERDPDEHSPVSLQLRDVRSEGRPLLRAAERGHSHLLRELLEHGLEADKVVDNSYSFTLQGVTRRNVTMLHQAARRGQEAVVELLLQYGAGADVQDGAGTTPIMCAADGGSLPVLKMLIERGARVNSADVDGSTALHLGARSSLGRAQRSLGDGATPGSARRRYGR